MTVTSAEASPVFPITPSIDGCVTELPQNRATWTSTQHFQFVAFWDPVAGCDPTIHQPIVLHEWIENFDGTGGLKVQTLLDLFPKCGRIQFDAHAYINPTSNVLDDMGLVSLVFNTGVDCTPTPPLTAGLFPLEVPPDFPPFPPDGPTPQAPIPEPASLALLGTGLLMLRRVARKRPASPEGGLRPEADALRRKARLRRD